MEIDFANQPDTATKGIRYNYNSGSYGLVGGFFSNYGRGGFEKGFTG
ncbi:MAG: hypothetical protein IJ222_06275 [Bacteroidales bacterium]|nr:hypothetical protein [Bacteroidales bacterium]